MAASSKAKFTLPFEKEKHYCTGGTLLFIHLLIDVSIIWPLKKATKANTTVHVWLTYSLSLQVDLLIAVKISQHWSVTDHILCEFSSRQTLRSWKCHIVCGWLSFIPTEVFPSHTHTNASPPIQWEKLPGLRSLKPIKLSLHRDCSPKFQLVKFLETVVKTGDMFIWPRGT